MSNDAKNSNAAKNSPAAENLDPEIRERLELLIDTLRIDQLTSSQADELDYILKEHPAARREYILAMSLSGELRRLSEIEHSAYSSRAEANRQEMVESGSPSLNQQQSPQLGFLKQTAQSIGNYFSQPASLSVITAMFIMACMLVTLALIYFPSGGQGDGQGENLAQKNVPTQGKVVAHLSRSINARWADENSKLAEESPLRTQQHYKLLEGKIKITLFSGVESIVVAPAQFELLAKDQIRLVHGNLTGKVPAGVKDFTVHTSVARIIDLSTEFGVHVDQDQSTSVKVYVGKVQVDSNTKNSSTILNANESLVIRPDGTLDTKVKVGIKFQRELPTRSDERGENYSEYVHSLKPLSYWQFEEGPTAKVIQDSSKNRYQAQFVSMVPSNAYQAGHFGKYALNFDGISRNRINLESVKALPEEFVISAWIKPRTSGFDRRGMIMNYETAQDRFVLAVASDPSGQRRWRELTCYTKFGQMSSGQNSIAFHRWNHVVFAAKKDTTGQRWYQLYLNGKLAQRKLANNIKPHNPTQTEPRKWLLGCRDSKNNSFDGLIDDLIIFDHTLSENEIHQLYKLGK